MPDPTYITLAQIAPLAKVTEKLEKLDPLVEKKFPGIKKLLEDIYDMDPSRTTVDKYKELVTKLSETVKEVEKFKATIKPVIITAFSAAKGELLGKDAKLCQALAAVERGDKGRSGPKEPGVAMYNHIHIGGNASDNLLFQVQTGTVLGRLKFHMETGLSDGKKSQIKSVAGRSGGKIQLQIVGDEVVLKP